MDNPYQTGAHGNPYPSSTGQTSPAIIQALAGTKPWVRLCSIIGFICAGFMVLGGLMMMAGGAIGGMSNSRAAGFGWIQSIMGLIYIAMSLMYVFPSVKLWKYGTAILNLMSSQSATDLEQAMEAQRGFWKFVGIVILVSIGLMLIGMVLAIVAAGMAAASINELGS
ncbi:DUF5362 family protein [Luteolibacter flavescens]|uniref:DUF5362 family protein n=1 Tax=Luteolibacter flavescens TaxID=1859460 RepID=A0ABT3FSM7_9BACT|nr:DUF5362 family protein [Luteolibacter flavescens]MCW1886447.1 DUF5362 family protein [Luteolibacter flavescens]